MDQLPRQSNELLEHRKVIRWEKHPAQQGLELVTGHVLFGSDETPEQSEVPPLFPCHQSDPGPLSQNDTNLSRGLGWAQGCAGDSSWYGLRLISSNPIRPTFDVLHV